MTGKEPQTRHGISRSRSSSNSICSNNKHCNKTNPFEVQKEQLSQRLCSPSVFRSRSPEAPASSRSFMRSFEQKADLFPVNIDEEHLSSLQPEEIYDPSEEQSQHFIDLFSSTREIVLSPLKHPSRVTSPAAKPLVRTVAYNQDDSFTQPQRVAIRHFRHPQRLTSVEYLGDYHTVHETQNSQAAREGITDRRSVRCMLFCSVVEEELTNESQGCQPLSPVSCVCMEGPYSMTPLHMVPHSSPISDSGFMRIRWSRGSNLQEQVTRLSLISRLSPSDQVSTRAGHTSGPVKPKATRA